MTGEQLPPTQEQQQTVFELSAEQAQQLFHAESAEAAQQLAHEFGAVALEGNVAVVVNKDEQGNEVASHYIDLGAEDIGTRINMDKNDNAEKYKDPSQALAELRASTQTAETETAAAESEEVKIAEIKTVIQESELLDKLNFCDTLRQTFEENDGTTAHDLDDAAADLNRLLASVNEAASNQPWSGTKFAEQTDLIRSAQLMAESLREKGRAAQYRRDNEGDQTGSFVASLQEPVEAVYSGLSSIDHEAVRQVAGVVQEIEAVARETAAARNNQLPDELYAMAGQLDELSFNGYLTTQDAGERIQHAFSMVQQLQNRAARGGASTELLDEQVKRLKSLMS